MKLIFNNSIIKKLRLYTIFAIALLLAVTICSNYWIVRHSEIYCYDDIERIPTQYAAILLGTSKTLSNGTENLYFKYRILAAVELWKHKKVKKIVVSGDNSRKTYDEPNDMRASLISQGVDSNSIILDYAGFRTFDSMIRFKEIFGQQSGIVVSQKFHNERAIYIASKLGMNIIGYNAKDVSQNYGLKTTIREHLARVKVILDFTLKIKPKFLGEKINI